MVVHAWFAPCHDFVLMENINCHFAISILCLILFKVFGNEITSGLIFWLPKFIEEMRHNVNPVCHRNPDEENSSNPKTWSQNMF
jgi:hypothetical protein